MTTLRAVCDFLDEFAPPILAESWDNVGLLAGDPATESRRVMTCLTITPGTVAEAIGGGADLVVAHHPLPFHPLRRVVTDTLPGRLLWQLLSHRVAIYSPHTAFDSTVSGINHALAVGLGLESIEPLVPCRRGRRERGAGDGDSWRPPSRSAAGRAVEDVSFRGASAVCGKPGVRGAAGGCCLRCGRLVVTRGHAARCDVLVLGETNLHTCVEADASPISLLLPGHYATERFAVERLAQVLAARFPDLAVWASVMESDPLRSC